MFEVTLTVAARDRPESECLLTLQTYTMYHDLKANHMGLYCFCLGDEGGPETDKGLISLHDPRFPYNAHPLRFSSVVKPSSPPYAKLLRQVL